MPDHNLYPTFAVNDMFWDEPWDADAAIAACQEQWGVTPRPFWCVLISASCDATSFKILLIAITNRLKLTLM